MTKFQPKFKTVADVKKTFLSRSMGGDVLPQHAGVRLQDLDKHAHIVERLLQSDYNKISGFSFSELMEAVSYIASNYNSPYYLNTVQEKGMKVNESAIQGESDYMEVVSEAFEATTIAQSPFPIPSVGMSLYHYERAVLPFLAHVFDLKGNRGYVYYQRLNALNGKGNVNAGDLLASPKEIGTQPLGFVGTKAINETVATTATGTTAYIGTLANTPIMPGTVVITVAGQQGYFKDYANPGSRETGAVQLVSVNGNLGTATVNYQTGEVTVDLADAPTEAVAIQATYDRDIQTVAGGTANLAEVDMTLDSKLLVAEDFGVKTDSNVQQNALAKAVFGLDWNDQLDGMLVKLWNKEIANKVVSEIKDAMPTANIAEHDISKNIANGGNNAIFNVYFINVVLGKLNQLIAESSGLQTHRVSTIVVAQNVVPVLYGLEEFETATGAENNMGGMAIIGKYRGIPVVAGFKPILADGEVIGLYRNQGQDFLTPYAFGMFIAPFIRDIFDNSNLAVNRKQLIASGAGAVCAERLSAKLIINGISDII